MVMTPPDAPSPLNDDLPPTNATNASNPAPASDGGRRAESRAPETSPLVVDFDSLAKGRKELFISYQGQRYRLSTTRNGKLILTK